MADCSQLSSSAISAVVGGGVAIGVTWLAHWFTAKRELIKATNDTEREQQKIAAESERIRRGFLREKLEDLLMLVGEHVLDRQAKSDYVAALGVYSGQGQRAPESLNEPVSKDSLERADAIATMYFPELAALLAELNTATGLHITFLSEEMDSIAADARAWFVQRRPEYALRQAQAMLGLLQGRRRLSQAAKAVVDQRLAP